MFHFKFAFLHVVALALLQNPPVQGALKTVFSDVDEALHVYNSSLVSDDVLQLATVMAYMKSRFSEVLQSDQLDMLSEHALITLLAKNWIVEEFEVCKAVYKYFKTHTDLGATVKRALVNQIHFVAIQPSQLISDEVQDLGVLPQRAMLNILVFLASGGHQIEKMFRYPNQMARSNVALGSMGAEIISSNCKGSFLGDYVGNREICIEQMFTVKLGAVFTVSEIHVSLYHEVDCLMVETSLDNKEKHELHRAEHTKIIHVNFEPMRIRYINVKNCGADTLSFYIDKFSVGHPR